jgi:acetyltransferase-like isoleucine patch superfamily enzyme
MLEKVGKILRVVRTAPPSALWRGLLLRRHFHADGLILALPGGPSPRVKNHGGEIRVESCCFEAGVSIEVYPGACLTIGKGTYFNRNCVVIAAESVRIGRWVKIGWDVVIMDTDLHGHSGRPACSRPVVIEDEVWIGCRALVLKGVHVGRGAIIAAGAIVTKDVPPRTIVASPTAEVVSSISAPASGIP